MNNEMFFSESKTINTISKRELGSTNLVLDLCFRRFDVLRDIQASLRLRYKINHRHHYRTLHNQGQQANHVRDEC